MPRSAISKRPFRSDVAPVNDPFSCPNSSDSSRLSASAAQLTGDERPRRSRRQVVDRARHELLAGPALALDQDRRVDGRVLGDPLEHDLDGFGAADDARPADELLARQEAPGDELELVGVERLGENLVDPAKAPPLDALDVHAVGERDHCRPSGIGGELLEELPHRRLVEPAGQDDQRDAVPGEHALADLAQRVDHVDPMARLAERALGAHCVLGVVAADEDAHGWWPDSVASPARSATA